uniref:Uncharacterized protein n=1 Tax=Anguilla anguilla TaxID=7936 RepID=A0A0E9SNA5_ANGAN
MVFCAIMMGLIVDGDPGKCNSTHNVHFPGGAGSVVMRPGKLWLSLITRPPLTL